MIPEDNQNKPEWCVHGGKFEKEFVKRMLDARCGCVENPAKGEVPYTHDLFLTFPGDLKTIRTRFNTSGKYGIPSHSAITLNAKDVDRYTEKYPHILIIFDVEYEDFSRVCYASLREIKRAIQLGKAKLHTYKDRIDDTEGNAKDSWVLDANWFQKFY